jgi:arsenate reductase
LTTNTHDERLTTEQQLQIRQAAERLRRQFQGELNTETIERFMTDSLDTLLPRATTTTWVPLLAERFTRDRLRALLRLESHGTDLAPSVLFLCVHNAGRSQMAAGWMRFLAGDAVEVFSGGSEPAESINQAAVAAMAEVGVDIAEEIDDPSGKSIDDVRPIRDELRHRIEGLMEDLGVV